MFRPTAIDVCTLDDKLLRVVFDNNEVRVFDVKPYIKGSWFSRLNDDVYFSQVRTNNYSVEWPDGQDICPDELYYNSKTQDLYK